MLKAVVCGAALLLVALLPEKVRSEPAHGIAMHGNPALPQDFKHLPYVNPHAPKGGQLRLAVTGSFDSVNPLIIKGSSAAGVRSYVIESLMARNLAEPFALYGLIAQSIEVNDERTRVTFRLRKEARFSDGQPITSADVLFSLNTLKEKGRPNHRTYYAKVIKATAPDKHTVVYELQPGDRELVLILGLMPVLPQHFFKDRAFDATTLEPMVGSGPYVMAEIKPGERIVYKRNPEYWGRHLAVSKGLWNFDEVRFDYFRDTQSGFEAFKKGLVDVRSEGDPGRWAESYSFPVPEGQSVVRNVIKTGLPRPVSGLVFNTRQKIFSDAKVREALMHAFDFEWANANLFHGSFKRTQGYFDGSVLSFAGHPADEVEMALARELGLDLDKALFDGTFRQPVSDGKGRNRKNLRQALKLLASAGWRIDGGILKSRKTGEAFSFELLIQNSDQERVGLHFQRALRQIGITMSIRQVDSAQFQQRRQTYTFDMMPFTWYSSLSPGNEQTFRWGSAGRERHGTFNLMGLAEPAIDQTIAAMLKARDLTAFQAAVRLLDRQLVAGHYIVPLYHAPGQWIARWDRISLPKSHSLYGFQASAAWFSGR